eukprot:TRINITY_DN624_c0_g1_i3.p1 TRINITY_DN624_c0_g1~~TRINITY_DN624_c0_g1_i3.p1  ORF type:complete len:104 (-),score=0.23 TRINITY_DN624_c0_g1_i3:102-413(-)
MLQGSKVGPRLCLFQNFRIFVSRRFLSVLGHHVSQIAEPISIYDFQLEEVFKACQKLRLVHPTEGEKNFENHEQRHTGCSSYRACLRPKVVDSSPNDHVLRFF